MVAVVENAVVGQLALHCIKRACGFSELRWAATANTADGGSMGESTIEFPLYTPVFIGINVRDADPLPGVERWLTALLYCRWTTKSMGAWLLVGLVG